MFTDELPSPNSIQTANGGAIELPDAPIHADTDQISDVIREASELSPARSMLVKGWIDKVGTARERWAPDFKRMKDNIEFSSGAQWPGDTARERYQANITQRHLQQRVAQLYAKNPEVVCKQRKRMDYKIWDENMSTLGIVQQQVAVMQQTGVPVPATIDFINDFAQATQQRQKLKKIARTLEILFQYTLDTQLPPFKLNMKQLVRRTLATGVGYVKIGFKRTLKPRPEDVSKVNVLTEAMKSAQRRADDRVDDEITADSPEMEVLRQQIAQAEANTREMIDFEGLTFDFPQAHTVIIDPACTHLRTFTGAKWIAHEFVLSRNDIQEIYGVDVKGAQSVDGITEVKPTEANGYLVWEVYEKATGQVFTIMKGYSDYLREPASPEFWLNRFWPIFPLCFNELESNGTKDDTIFPKSDVELLKPIQLEYNRSREALRQHRIANRPRQVVRQGSLSDTDLSNLSSAGGNTVIQLQGMQPGENIQNNMMPVPVVPLDPQVYDVNALFQDMLRTVGTQESTLGGLGGGTATESSIAEASRASSISSNVDDLDDLLTEVCGEGGQVLLNEMSPETVEAIVGPGAVWPTEGKEAIIDALLLKIRAGSSGRPNQAMEIQNFERLMPFFMQIPGIKPEWVAREAVKRLDDDLDFADAWIENVPSMIAQNAMTQLPGSAPEQNPAAQGNNGGQNKPSAQGSQSGGPPQMAPSMSPPQAPIPQ